MKISSKGRYAVRIMAELAKHSEFMPVSELSIIQEIPPKYLEQILGILTRGGLVESLRGSSGGYILSREPENISIAEILQLTGDMPKLAPCMQKGCNCNREKKCESVGCWEKLGIIIVKYLSDLSLEDLLEKKY